MSLEEIKIILSLSAILGGGLAIFNKLFGRQHDLRLKRKDGNQWVEISDFPSKRQLEELRSILANDMVHSQSPVNFEKLVNLQVWISASIIGLANFIPFPAVQGLISLISVFAGHSLANWLNEEYTAKQRKKLNILLEDEITFIGHLLPGAPEARRSQLQKQISDYHRILSDNNTGMLEFETPSTGKKSSHLLFGYPQSAIEILRSLSFQVFPTGRFR